MPSSRPAPHPHSRPRRRSNLAGDLLAATPYLRLVALALVGIAAAAYGLYRGMTYVHPPFFVPAPPDAGEVEAPDLVPLPGVAGSTPAQPSGAPPR